MIRQHPTSMGSPTPQPRFSRDRWMHYLSWRPFSLEEICRIGFARLPRDLRRLVAIIRAEQWVEAGPDQFQLPLDLTVELVGRFIVSEIPDGANDL